MSAAAAHQRINEQLEDYWQELRGHRPMPMESEVNIKALKEIWPYCFLVKVDTDTFAYSYLGDQLIEAYGDDITGKEIAETLLEPPHPRSLYNAFQEVVRTTEPRTDESEFANSNKQLIKYRSCILPLGSRSHLGVAYLLGGMKWKAS